MQVCLDGNADIWPGAEFRFLKDVTKDAYGEVFERKLLHIDIDERAAFLGESQQRP